MSAQEDVCHMGCLLREVSAQGMAICQAGCLLGDGVCLGVFYPGGVCLRGCLPGCVCPKGCLPGGVCQTGSLPQPQWTEGMTHTYENIISVTTIVGGNYMKHEEFGQTMCGPCLVLYSDLWSARFNLYRLHA